MKNDRILGISVLFLGLLTLFLTMQIPVKTFTDDPGPRVFPYFGSIILIICGIGILSLRKKKSADPAEKPEPFLTPEGWKRAGTMTLLFVIYAVALWLLGFIIATPIMVYLFYREIAGPKKRFVVRGILFSLLTTGGIYFVFANMLHSFLPPGMIF